MNELPLDDTVARRFLLGQLSEEEQGQIAERAFTDPESFIFLQAVEADLIDDFLYGDLSPEEEEQFQGHFLSKPGRRHNLRIAKALQKHVTQDVTQDEVLTEPNVVPPPLPEPAPWFKRIWPQSTPLLSFAAILLILLAVLGAWLIMRMVRKQEQTPIEAHEQQPQPLQSPASSSPSPASPSPSPAYATASPQPKTDNKRSSPQLASAIYSVLLAPGGAVRSDGHAARRFPLPAGHREIEFNLALTEPSSYRVFEATLESNDQIIRQWSGLHPHALKVGRGVTVQAPVDLFQSQKNYRIRLSGVSRDQEPVLVNNYNFFIE